MTCECDGYRELAKCPQCEGESLVWDPACFWVCSSCGWAGPAPGLGVVW